MNNQFELLGLSDLIFSDRYALKDPFKNFCEGDKVLATVSAGLYDQKVIGRYIERWSNDSVLILINGDPKPTVINDSKVERIIEKYPNNMWSRMAKWLAIKTEEDEVKYTDEFKWLLNDFRFSPGGRINTTLGTEELRYIEGYDDDFDGHKNTVMNCYVIPLEPNDPSQGKDSRASIMDTMKNKVETMSLGGGVGITISALRPNQAYISGVNGNSSGAVSWGSLFSSSTGLISQGGSRRGALMENLHDWHPDIIEFIFSKVRPELLPEVKKKWEDKFPKANFVSHNITNANISVLISDEFIRCVKNDTRWFLEFPDYLEVGKEIYNKYWDGDLKSWKEKGLPVKIYDTIRARDLWDALIESNWRSGEPGVIFIDKMRREHNGEYLSRILGTNPCGGVRLT